MHELHNSVKFGSLLYHYKGSTDDKDFSICNNAKSIFDMIKNKEISLSHAEENQANLKSSLADIKVGGKKKLHKKR